MSFIKLNNSQQEFIKNEIFGMSWNASVQHNKVYKDIIGEIVKKEFRTYIKVFIEDIILVEYVNVVNESAHNNNINEIAKHAEEKFSFILENEIYKIGTAQKILNLLLKYYWCLGLIKKPPHCPIDRIILSVIGLNGINWTNINTINEYKEIISKIKDQIGKRDLSDWELDVWKRRRTII